MKKSLFLKIDGLVIFLTFVLFRLKDLGIDIINSDAFWWKTRTYNFGNALSQLDFAGTAQTYHPGVTLLWINYIAVKIFSVLNKFIFNNTLSERDLFFINHIIQKSFLVVVLGLLVTLIYIQLKKLFGTRFALIFFVLLTFTPFFVALTRVLHTDGILTLSIFLSFISLMSFYKTGQKINLIFSGFWLGLAVLTKSNSLIFIPLVLFIIIFEYLIKSPPVILSLSKDPSKLLKPILLLFSTALVTFIVLWPAMWVTPFQTLSKYLFGITEVGVSTGHIHYFLGKFTDNPGILYYPLSLLARVDEILIILFLLGIIWYIKHKSKVENRYIFYSLIFIIFYIVILSFPSKKLDRYILPTFPFIALVATYFVSSITKKLHIKLRLVIPVLLINLLITDMHFHPDYMAYYSNFVGGPDKGRQYIDPTWPIGYASLTKYFNNMENAENISVAVHDEFSFRPFFAGKTIDIENADQVKNADFIVTYSFMPEKIELPNFTKKIVFKV
ncbi:MAG: glycosyltransferase family 39 protein, partial [bacterium]|nr:glycosyltransferase family 39 protein [bacterium]